MPLSDLATRTHPRDSGAAPQLCILAGAALVGALLGLVLLLADHASWSGARTTTATVAGTSDKGVLAQAAGRQVVLHMSPVPTTGSTLRVEVSPDGRARPASFAQTPLRATRSGVALAVLLTMLVQGYRYAVTRRA